MDLFTSPTFGTARNFNQRLGQENEVRQLQHCLDEEKASDFRLSQLAEKSINPITAHA